LSIRNRLFLVDGMSLLFRGFYATSSNGYYMKTKNGTPTNAIYGFLKYFLDAAALFQPSHVICCWDMGSQTFRTELYDQYKANRGEPPEELIPQFDLIKEVTEAFGIPNIGVSGYEADDCIGTLARRFCHTHEVVILTGDQDLLQLVDEKISVAVMKKGQGNYAVYHHENFYEEKGLHPSQIADLKGLMGDASDNYPGVKGIGEKTAIKLLQEFHTIDGILENLSNLSKGIRTKIENNLEMLKLSRTLATIHCEAPVTCSLEACQWPYDKERVKKKFEELEFGSLMKLIG